MQIGLKPVLLLGLVFTMTPYSLDAAPPASSKARLFGSVHVYRAKVKGIQIASRLDYTAKGGMTVVLDVHNPGKRTVTAKL